LAAAVVARAAEWAIDVYIPPDASAAVVRRLGELDARIHVCRREAEAAGDPCVTAFRRAVSEGAIPFGVQGSENGLCVEGGHTLGWELAAQLGDATGGHHGLDAIYVQVGGGALAAGLYQGLREARELGVLARLPRLYTVQTQGAWPLRRAWERWRAAGIDLEAAVRDRRAFMWPWETEPRSIAHGILDDETYEWAAVLAAMDESGGEPLVVDEDTLREANRVGREATGISASHTGTAGLAGVLARRVPGRIGVLFTGVDR
jgi:threonine synthase